MFTYALTKRFVITTALTLVSILVPMSRTAMAADKPATTYNVDEPGRVPYQTGLNCTVDPNSTNARCTAQRGPVPAGRQLVIREVSLFLRLSGVNAGSGTQLLFGLGPNHQPHPFNVSVFNPLGNSGGHVQLLVFFEAGHTIDVDISLPFPVQFDPSAAQILFLRGYVVDCTVAPCSPQAHF
jgi:hypothetical protein